MGKVVEKKRKKKKGRPSLLDLQKRSLKQQQEQQQEQHQQQQKQQQQQQQQQKQQHRLQKSNPLRRSTRRNPNPNSDDDDGTTRRKKLKHVLRLRDEDVEEENSGSDDEGSDSSGSDSNPKRRKIGSIVPGSDLHTHDKGEKHSAATNQTSPEQGSKLDDGPSTPLPDKKLLLFILDRLQKKDTYGVFADPVDPEELPDYHEVIAHPMDFSTVRKKLTTGAYAYLEQFEKDVFLICSNAMQYNAPETIYFRQARAIQEMAKKDFENLRQDSDDNEAEQRTVPEPKVVRRGRPPTKNLKRPPGRPPLEHPKPQVERANSVPTQATLATAGGSTSQSNNDVRKGPLLPEKYGSPDLFARFNYGVRFSETYNGWSSERYGRIDDLTGSASKGIMMKHGKKNIVLDESRRSTYLQSSTLASREEPSVLTTFDEERKNLIPVGLHFEHGYARSLARFAAKLGPVAWKVASRKIQRCLPAGVKFGPGWVGENEAPAERQQPQQLPPPTAAQPSPPACLPISGDSASASDQGRLESNHSTKKEEEQSSKTIIQSIQPKADEGSSKALPPSARTDSTQFSSSPVIVVNGGATKLKASEASTSSHPNTTPGMLNRNSGALKAGQSPQVHQNVGNHPRINGLNGSYGLSFAAQMGKMIGAARPTAVSKSEADSLGHPSADRNGFEGGKVAENSSAVEPSDSLPNAKASLSPPDLNVGFQSPGSPCSGRADSVHPDLALQL